MNVHFAKYQATGNDFIVINNRNKTIRLTTPHIRQLCHRRWGIGADGLILIEPSDKSHFLLTYFNADGSQSLCGNGSRAAVHFAHQQGIVPPQVSFEAYDGLHQASLLPNGHIRISLNSVQAAEPHADGVFIYNGSPHFIKWVQQLENYPVVPEGRSIRYSARFESRGGTNVNFAQPRPDNTIAVRTYERGVEDETLSCGTGVTATALAAALQLGYKSPVHIATCGGQLMVEFARTPSGGFQEIYLTGPAEQVFTGQINL